MEQTDKLPDSSESSVAARSVETQVAPPTPEALQSARQTLAQTLELDEIDLKNLPAILREQVKTLPRYQSLEQALNSTSSADLPLALFEHLRTMHSEPKTKESPQDGVLIRSIREGSLACAGKTLIASTYLKERGIEHSVVATIAGEGGHSVLLIDVDNDTYAYCDGENNLYFTFPKQALTTGVYSQSVTREMIADFKPRPKDITIGLSSISRTFVRIDPDIGITHQYLDNTRAALNGNREFGESRITYDPKAADAISFIERQILIDDAEAIEMATGGLYEKGIDALEDNNYECHEIVWNTYEETGKDKKLFCAALTSMFQTNTLVAKLFPYLQHSSEEKRREAAQKIWQELVAHFPKAPMQSARWRKQNAIEIEREQGELLRVAEEQQISYPLLKKAFEEAPMEELSDRD